MAQKADQCTRFRDAVKSERILSAHDAVIGVTVFELTEGGNQALSIGRVASDAPSVRGILHRSEKKRGKQRA